MNESCKACGLYKYSPHWNIQGKGSADPRIVMIGEAPGITEAKDGMVFVGKAEKKLHAMLVPYFDLGIWITNAVKCLPPVSTVNPMKGFRVPKPYEVYSCNSLLWDEIHGFKHVSILVPMGNTALYAITGRKEGITRHAGKVMHIGNRGRNYTVIPNFHPSYVCRNPNMEQAFRAIMDIVKEKLC